MSRKSDAEDTVLLVSSAPSAFSAVQAVVVPIATTSRFQHVAA